MKFFVSFLFLLTFLSELTLDTSTSFVRANNSVNYTFSEDLDPGPGSTQSDSKLPKHTTKLLETTAHAALPVIEPEHQIWSVDEINFNSVEIAIPRLNPPVSRIDRPPIA